MYKRNLYLSNIPPVEALDKYIQALGGNLGPKEEIIPVSESLGRTTWEAVYALYNVPMFNAAAMDGIAVISEKTHHASETNPVTLALGEDFEVVDTGDPIHEPFDAVIMAEDVPESDQNNVQVMTPVASWQHIRPIGEDIVSGEMILPSRHRIRAIDVGVLLAAGITEVKVVKKPSIGIFPTGTELIEPGQVPQEGSIIESNSRMFENLVLEQGGSPVRYGIIQDDFEQIKKEIRQAVAQHDMVIINAGSSAGREDYTVHVLEELGDIIVHGVAVKPGKPVILAIIEGKPVIGLPGYPVSAYIDFQGFVTPLLSKMLNKPLEEIREIKAIISKRLVSSLKYKEYVRVKLGKVGDKLVASPLQRGAGAAMSLVKADGFCIIPQQWEGLEAGEEATVELYRSMAEIENTLVVIGSHDMILDIAGDFMSSMFPGSFLSSTHIGSMGGLMALLREEAHMAPIHLLDEATGTYNIPYLQKMFEEPMALIKGVGRIQGIMVKKGNPLGITGLGDLKNGRYVNRQRGAGTRILLDYKLKQAGILPEEIKGYDRESATHMAVAALVKSPSADAGMGIYAAAKAMDLDFIEIGPEEYDFALPAKYLDHPLVQQFIEILKSELFQSKLMELGGYDTSRSGQIILL